jgi:hypothetical protein
MEPEVLRPWSLHHVKLGRNYYAQSDKILCWLLDHVGPGVYYQQYHVGVSPPVREDQALWKWEQAFGHTTIQFKREEHLIQFKLTWR